MALNSRHLRQPGAGHSDSASIRSAILVDAAGVAPNGTIYLTDASRFSFDHYVYDLYEHRPNGRLLPYDPRTATTRLIMDGLYFANGVAISPDASFLLVNEMTAYRVRKVWLSGERAGTSEVLVDNLPGFPDNISFNGRGIYWVGLARGRGTRAALDRVLLFPWVRKVLFLAGVKAPADGNAWVIGSDNCGAIARNLQDPEGRAYHNITAAVESNGVLYLGSTEEIAIGRFQL